MPAVSDSKARARALWRYVGDDRPAFAVAPAAGQESVWDYPRPPRIVEDGREIVIRLGTVEIAHTQSARRVLETASPPTFYLPRRDIRMDLLAAADGASFCEWKGAASYLSVVTPTRRLDAAAWWYPDPLSGFEQLRDHVAFYPQQLECLVDGVRAQPQPGRFYAGWITPDVVGPFKGDAGSGGW